MGKKLVFALERTCLSLTVFTDLEPWGVHFAIVPSGMAVSPYKKVLTSVLPSSSYQKLPLCAQVLQDSGTLAKGPLLACQVEFEDGSQLVVKRDDVYTLDEELPKRVKSRLSVASDMRFNEIFTEKEVKQEKKRQRVINSRYREDYIEPALYRAIME